MFFKKKETGVESKKSYIHVRVDVYDTEQKCELQTVDWMFETTDFINIKTEVEKFTEELSMIVHNDWAYYKKLPQHIITGKYVQQEYLTLSEFIEWNNK